MNNSISKAVFAIIIAAYASADIASAETAPQSTINPQINTILQKAVTSGIEKSKAKNALGVVLDINTGEVLANVSIGGAELVTKQNYENAPALRIITYAQAIETGKVTPSTVMNVGDSPQVGGVIVKDAQPGAKDLTVTDAFVAASNIAGAKLALQIGPSAQRKFFEKLHQLKPIETGTGSTVTPTFHPKWDADDAAVIGFGHGVANSPLHAASAVASIINGHLVTPTFVKKPQVAGPLIVGGQTSETMTKLLATNVERGRAKHADLPVVHVAALTGTTEKIVDGHYAEGKLQCEAIAVAPTEKPRFLLLVLMNEPEQFDAAAPAATTAGIVAAEFFREAGPLVGLK